jgi:alkylation response protein AidB-like acyl-CoA dehydrogenase
MSDLELFRAETRAWLEVNCPGSMREPYRGEDDQVWGGRNAEYKHPDQKVWLDRMAARGWTTPTWPKEYGGGGLDPKQARILAQEMRRLKCRRPLDSFGISMLGPALLRYASEEIRREHMPKIIKGEIRWCQGYSEPGAGSDLASLQTRAEDCGDHYLVNGSKIWTSYADQADWIFALVRTDNSGTKHEGISFLLIDMADPGVTTSPIKLISGRSPFCETFLDDVRVPKSNLVGEEGNGWTIAKFLLTHEREMISGFGSASGRKKLSELALEQMGSTHGQLSDPVMRSDITHYEIDSMAFAATMTRVGDEAKSGQGLGAASSIFKYYGTELNKRRNELNIAVNGERALGWEGEEYSDGSTVRAWLRSKGNSIEGGTSEVQLNIIAKRVLGLPSE